MTHGTPDPLQGIFAPRPRQSHDVTSSNRNFAEALIGGFPPREARHQEHESRRADDRGSPLCALSKKQLPKIPGYMRDHDDGDISFFFEKMPLAPPYSAFSKTRPETRLHFCKPSFLLDLVSYSGSHSLIAPNRSLYHGYSRSRSGPRVTCSACA